MKHRVEVDSAVVWEGDEGIRAWFEFMFAVQNAKPGQQVCVYRDGELYRCTTRSRW